MSDARILLMIEPNDDKFAAYSHVLQSEDFDIKRATTADEAFLLIEKSAADIQIILLDWLLPEPSGYVVAQRLRDIEALTAQLLVCTKTMSEEDLVLLGELDIYHWFNSNGDANILVDKIKAAKKEYTETSPSLKSIRQLERALAKEDVAAAKELLAKNDLEKSLRELPRYHYCLAEYFILSREPKAAVDLLTATLKSQGLKGDTLKNYASLGKAYCLLGNHRDALDIFQKLTAKSPKNFSHKIMLGDAHLGLDETKKAREQYKDVLSSDTGNKDALVGMAKAEIVDNNIEGAQQFFSQIKGSFESYTLASFFNNRAVALTKANKAQEAVVLYENAIQFLKKFRGHVYFNLGNAYTRLGEHEKANQAYNTAATLAPPELLSKKTVLKKLSSKANEDFVDSSESSKKKNFSL